MNNQNNNFLNRYPQRKRIQTQFFNSQNPDVYTNNLPGRGLVGGDKDRVDCDLWVKKEDFDTHFDIKQYQKDVEWFVIDDYDDMDSNDSSYTDYE